MLINKITQASVGADLSASRGLSQYPVYFVKSHHCSHLSMLQVYCQIRTDQALFIERNNFSTHQKGLSPLCSS
jgi:hypothetical protein